MLAKLDGTGEQKVVERDAVLQHPPPPSLSPQIQAPVGDHIFTSNLGHPLKSLEPYYKEPQWLRLLVGNPILSALSAELGAMNDHGYTTDGLSPPGDLSHGTCKACHKSNLVSWWGTVWVCAQLLQQPRRWSLAPVSKEMEGTITTDPT